MRRVSARQIAAALGQHPPTPEQEAVIEAPLRPQVVIAGAGSGKTETMAARVVWLVANGLVHPEQVLGLTFTRKAAGELSERITRRLRALRASGLTTGDPGGGDPALLPATVATYNAYAASLVRDHGLRVRVEPGARLLGEAATWQLVHDIVLGWDPQAQPADEQSTAQAEDLGGLGRTLDTVVQAVVSLSGQCAEHLLDPSRIARFVDDFEQTVTALPGKQTGTFGPSENTDLGRVLAGLRNRRALVPVIEAYRRRKQQTAVLDFGDQIAIAADLATHPDLARGERDRFTVVLLDEFQDTSHAQLELLARLFGAGHAVTAVGDPNQSIYGWRGASAGNLHAFTDRFADPSGPPEVLNLTTSWRNDRTVLAVANHLAQDLRTTSPVPVEALVPSPVAGPGRVEVTWHPTRDEEAAWVADQVAARWATQTRPSTAVLCRQRSQFPALVEALTGRGLPVEVVGLGGLLQRPEVADLLATLQVLDDPTRNDALVRLLSGPRWLIGPRDLAALGSLARERAGEESPGAEDHRATLAGDPQWVREPSLVDALDRLPEPGATTRDGLSLSATARSRLTRLARELRRLRRLTGLPLTDLVVETERALLLEVELTVAGSGRPARTQLDAFLDITAEFTDGTAHPSLAAFLSWLQVAAERERGLTAGQEEDDRQPPRDGAADTAVQNPDVVQVMTVHAAKGLEWDLVVIPGMSEGRFPSVRSSNGQDRDSGWTAGMAELPYDLRGDAGSLPVLRWRTAPDVPAADEEIKRFRADCGAHRAREERRLAYVAVTRARREALLCGYTWDHDVATPRTPSRFLVEVAALAGDPGSGVVAPDRAGLAADPGPDNPLRDTPPTATWPAEAPVPAVLAAAADAVWRATPLDLVAPGTTAEQGPLGALAEDASRLLAERRARRNGRVVLDLPAHLSASKAVALAKNPQDFAVDLRRPTPVEPQPTLRRGTAFHDWVERRLHSQTLLDLIDLPGAADDEAAADPELAAYQVAFERSRWARREVLDTEVDVETAVGDVVLRGRIDAVFTAPQQDAPVRYDLVDWKTGAEQLDRAAQVQLAVYRLAWSRLRQVPMDQVRASFFFVRTGRTVQAEQADLRTIEAALRRVPRSH